MKDSTVPKACPVCGTYPMRALFTGAYCPNERHHGQTKVNVGSEEFPRSIP